MFKKKKKVEDFNYPETKLVLFIKGIIVGMSNLIPGISAGTIAITLGLYENIIKAVNTIKNNAKKSFAFLLPIVIGMGIGLLAFSNVISFALANYPLATKFLFIGLIVGGMPILTNEIKSEHTTKEIIILVVSLLFVVGFAMLQSGATAANFANLDFMAIVKLIVVGIIAAFTMVVPGISGSLMMVLLGYFEPIVNVLKDLSHMGTVGHDLLILLPFGIGVLIGIAIAIKVIDYLLEHHKIPTYYGIVGFVVGSIITILMSINYATSIGEYLLGAGLFIFGYLGALRLGDKK
jgi:putative membrane protein